MSLTSAPTARELRASEIAWLAAVPCAIATILAILVLGPPLGDLLSRPSGYDFWALTERRPEPTEQARFLIALLGAFLLAAVVVLASKRLPGPLPIATTRRLVVAAQLALVAFIAICFAAQNELVLSAHVPKVESARFFTLPTLVAALALVLLLIALMRQRAVATLVARGIRETRRRRIACAAVALLFTALWLLTAVQLDSSVGSSALHATENIPASLSETFAILNGRTPLVDFHAGYGQLWPYVVAATMSVVGSTLAAYTIAMACIAGLILLVVYAILRRMAGSAPLAVALYLPFVATGFFMKDGPLDDRYSPANLFSLWPVRYAGPYVLAWLLVRHVDGLRPRRPTLLFLTAGLVLINNPEFGASALAALVLALVAVAPPRSRAAAVRLLGDAAVGLLGALALVVLLTLVRSGSLPRLGLLLEFPRIYGIGGLTMLPMPTIGFHLVVYVTYAAALVVGIVRAVRGDEDRALTAMLTWSGVFGLATGGYYAGHSHPQVLIDLFSPWTLTLALLVVVVVRSLAAREWRRPTIAELAVLFGFGLAICSLPQTPTPWSQISRLGDRTATPLFKQPAATAFIASQTSPGEKVAILMPLGHRIAHDAGIVNVFPYASQDQVTTRQQLTTALEALREAGGTKVFISNAAILEDVLAALQAAGFTAADRTVNESQAQIVELVDG